jgi:hypothetical protein
MNVCVLSSKLYVEILPPKEMVSGGEALRGVSFHE